MAGAPEWFREGWKAAGPRRCRCPRCGAVVSTNALPRAHHAKQCRRRDLEAKAVAQQEGAEAEC